MLNSKYKQIHQETGWLGEWGAMYIDGVVSIERDAFWKGHKKIQIEEKQM